LGCNDRVGNGGQGLEETSRNKENNITLFSLFLLVYSESQSGSSMSVYVPYFSMLCVLFYTEDREVLCSFKTLVMIYQIMHCQIPEDSNLH
jgi:hypothetical protein